MSQKKATEITYKESAPDSENQVTITIIDSTNNEKARVVVERFSEDEMDFLREMVLRLKKNGTNGNQVVNGSHAYVISG